MFAEVLKYSGVLRRKNEFLSFSNLFVPNFVEFTYFSVFNNKKTFLVIIVAETCQSVNKKSNKVIKYLNGLCNILAGPGVAVGRSSNGLNIP